MGRRYKFRCRQCQHTANVSGGEDRGRAVKTQTMWCEDCKSLKDVIVGRLASPEPLEDDEWESSQAQCSSCGSDALRPWARGEPCPNCGGTIEDRGVFMLWD
jgi:hypothetical protein